MQRARVLAAGVALGLAALGLAACTKDNKAAPGSEAAVTATDTACTIAQSELKAGVVKFSITNNGSKINEFYVFSGDRALGEVENISPSTTRTLNVELKAGTYQGVCKPGMVGEGIKAAFTVSGEATPLNTDAKLAFAVTSYRDYVKSQADLFKPKTKEFTDAIRAGDVARAKALFPVARSYYEAIEPVAESFGDLDPAIDAREGDTEPGEEWTGFHVLEKHLWETGDISKDKGLADKLDADVAKLVDLVKTVELQPLEIANGAKELLDEVATSKITGEEDRYSHTDLWDFAANVEGSEQAFEFLLPAVEAADPDLAAAIEQSFDDIEEQLEAYEDGEGYRSYEELTDEDRTAMQATLAALSEQLAQVAGVLGLS